MGKYNCNTCSKLSLNKFISLLIVVRVTCVGSCPTYMLENSGEKLCYLFQSYKLNWMDANSNCKIRGGNLLSIANYNEFLLLAQYFPIWQYFYIGLNDIKSEGHFVWSDNQAASNFFWYQGEPGGGTSENCVVIWAPSYLNLYYGDVACDRGFGFICKFQDYCDKNSCSANAYCDIVVNGYICTCKYGFRTSSSDIEKLEDQCQDINECALSTTNYCSSNSICNNFDGGYNCKCKCGFRTNTGIIESELDKCLVENCVLLNLSASYFIGEGHTYVNIITNCWCNLQNVSIYLQPEIILKFKRLMLGNSNVNDLNVYSNGKSFVIHANNLFKTTYASISAVFGFGENITVGKTNMRVNLQYTLFFSKDYVVKAAWKIYLISVEGLVLSQVNKMTPSWTYKQSNGTSLYTKTHQFVCVALKKRQPSPCYQRNVLTGITTFLPVQVLDVIGYDSNTTFIYGRTTKKNFIMVNINSMKPYIITKEKCSKIKTCNLEEN